MTTTTDWRTGSSDHAASNVKTATIIQFVPRANPKREEPQENDGNMRWPYSAIGYSTDCSNIPTDCGNLGHPWSGEDKA